MGGVLSGWLFGRPQVKKAKMKPSMWSQIQTSILDKDKRKQNAMSDYWVSFIEFLTIAIGCQGPGNQVSQILLSHEEEGSKFAQFLAAEPFHMNQ